MTLTDVKRKDFYLTHYEKTVKCITTNSKEIRKQTLWGRNIKCTNDKTDFFHARGGRSTEPPQDRTEFAFK